MGDWAVIRLDLDNPETGELVKILANIPIDWQTYITKVSEEHGIPGRYVSVLLLYDNDAYFPQELRSVYEKIEEKSQGDEK